MRQTILRKLYILIITAFAVICVTMLTPAQVCAFDDDELSGIPADDLTVKVGYFGGPYYEKHVFSLAELWKMDVVYGDYTFIDNMPSVVIDHVAGVRLSDIIDAAGIDLNSVQTLYFWTNDKTSSYYTAFTKASLIDTPRYVYHSLPENYDNDRGVGNAYATQDAERVDTVMALADDWTRVIAGATFGSDYLNLNTNTRFRLIYGQTDITTHTASRSAKWVHEIVVELGGAPTVSMDRSALKLKVGSVYRAVARVNAADSAISANAALTWSSSDEKKAVVSQDGTVKVLGDGPVKITASYGGASATLVINGGEGGNAGDASGDKGASDLGKANASLAPPALSPTAEAAGKPVEISVIEERGLSQAEKSIGSEGGVQNWRTQGMSGTAVALPDIQEKNPLTLVAWAALFTLLAASVIFRTYRFFKDIGGKINAFFFKSQ